MTPSPSINQDSTHFNRLMDRNISDNDADSSDYECFSRLGLEGYGVYAGQNVLKEVSKSKMDIFHVVRQRKHIE